MGKCPRCGSIDNDIIETTTNTNKFRCKVDITHEWTEEKSLP